MRVFLAALMAAAVGVPALAADAPPKFDTAALAKTVQDVSSDAFEGRGTGSAAEPKVIDYIVTQFKNAGLKPGGVDGGWTQPVPLARFEVSGPVKLSLTVAGKTRALALGDDVTAHTSQPVNHVTITNAPLVFVGFGTKAPECGWDDFKGVDLHGKIAVVLVNDPDFQAPQLTKNDGCFGGKAMTYYGRWTYKYEEAARQGAIGMLIVHETEPAGYGWATVKNSSATAQFDVVRDDPAKAHPLLEGWIQRDVAAALFKDAGLDFEAQKRAAQSAEFKPVALAGATFSADYAVQSSKITSNNIIGRLPGTARAGETVIYSAHWDHLGVGLPDAKGDKIYNGAVDNGTGIASLVELARTFAKAPAPQRTIVFMAVTGEEKGLLGSAYYGEHPLYPAATTAGVINMDALKPFGRAHNMATSGSGKVDLEDRLAALLKAQGRTLEADPEPEKGKFYRSDHFSFAKVGIPAISVQSGTDLLSGGEAEGMKRNQDYTAGRYHQPGDQYDSSWDLSGIAEDLGVLYTLGRELANSTTWPAWKPTAEFKTIRDRTAAERRVGS